MDGVFLDIQVSDWNAERRDTDPQWLAVWSDPRMKPMTDVYRRNLLAWRAQEKQP